MVSHLSSQVGPLGFIVAVIVWCYKTFAQISYVTEQNALVQRLIQEQRAELLAMREQDRKDLQLYSDRNREKMEAIMAGIRDEVKAMREDMKQYWQKR